MNSAHRVGCSPQLSPCAARQYSKNPSRRMPESRFLFCASGYRTANLAHDDQPSAWKMVSKDPPGYSGTLIKQHHTTKFTSDASRGFQCRHGGVWQPWQTLRQTKWYDTRSVSVRRASEAFHRALSENYLWLTRRRSESMCDCV